MNSSTGNHELPIQQAADLVRNARHLVALSGAGLSAGSGIPTYRGQGGLWTQHGTPPLLSYREFARDPAEWWRARLAAEDDPSHPVFQMKQAVDAAAPNAGHLALAEMERRGILRCVITQNVDNLHAEAGSRALLEIHGNRTRLRCLECGLRFLREGFDLAEVPPLCGECRGVLKLDTVMVRRTHPGRCAPGLHGGHPGLRLHAAGRHLRHGQSGSPAAPGCEGPGRLADRNQPGANLPHPLVRPGPHRPGRRRTAQLLHSI